MFVLAVKPSSKRPGIVEKGVCADVAEVVLHAIQKALNEKQLEGQVDIALTYVTRMPAVPMYRAGIPSTHILRPTSRKRPLRRAIQVALLRFVTSRLERFPVKSWKPAS